MHKPRERKSGDELAFGGVHRLITRITLDLSLQQVIWMNKVVQPLISPTWPRGQASSDPVGLDRIHIKSRLRWAMYLGLAAPCPGLLSSLWRVPAGTGPVPPTAPVAHHTVEGGFWPANPKSRMFIVATKLILPHKDFLWSRTRLDKGDSTSGRQSRCLRGSPSL